MRSKEQLEQDIKWGKDCIAYWKNHIGKHQEYLEAAEKELEALVKLKHGNIVIFNLPCRC